jgi:hypothetical protein
VALGTLASRLAEACSVCTAGRDEENAAAFLMTTIFMSVLPPLVVGSVVFVVWRRIRRLEAQSEERPDRRRAPAPAAAPVPTTPGPQASS